jgi:hypothetical protein
VTFVRIVYWIGGLQTPFRLSKTCITLFVILINLFSILCRNFNRLFTPSSHQDLSASHRKREWRSQLGSKAGLECWAANGHMTWAVMDRAIKI